MRCRPHLTAAAVCRHQQTETAVTGARGEAGVHDAAGGGAARNGATSGGTAGGGAAALRATALRTAGLRGAALQATALRAVEPWGAALRATARRRRGRRCCRRWQHRGRRQPPPPPPLPASLPPPSLPSPSLLRLQRPCHPCAHCAEEWYNLRGEAAQPGAWPPGASPPCMAAVYCSSGPAPLTFPRQVGVAQ